MERYALRCGFPFQASDYERAIAPIYNQLRHQNTFRQVVEGTERIPADHHAIYV